jgi:hypothetical protein
MILAFCPKQMTYKGKTTPLLSEAGTQKNWGACPQKSAPEQVRVSFCGHPAPLFFVSVPAKIPAAWFFAIFVFCFGQNYQSDIDLRKRYCCNLSWTEHQEFGAGLSA